MANLTPGSPLSGGRRRRPAALDVLHVLALIAFGVAAALGAYAIAAALVSVGVLR